MKKASASFANQRLSVGLQPGLRSHRIPADLATIAAAFKTLQELRHAADYDTLRRFERQQVVLHIEQVEDAIVLWTSVRQTQAAKLYLLSLLVGERVHGSGVAGSPT